MRLERLTRRWLDLRHGGGFITPRCSTNRGLKGPSFYGHGMAPMILTALSLKALILALMTQLRPYLRVS